MSNNTEALASLESRIMNLPADSLNAQTNDPRLAYLNGHRDARHAAAELVSAALAQAEQPAEKPEPCGWVRAADEAMTSAHIGVAEQSDSYEEARRKLNLLLCWQQDVATYFAKAEPAEKAQPVAWLTETKNAPPRAVGMKMTDEMLSRTDGKSGPFIWWYDVAPGSYLYAAPPAAQQPEPLRHKDIGRLWDQIDGPHLSSDQWAAMHRFCPLLLAAAAPQPTREFNNEGDQIGGDDPSYYAKARGQKPASPTAGMSIEQRILHVGGRNNAAGYVEFGSVQAVLALVRQVLRDLPSERGARELGIESALAALIDKIAPGLDSGDILADAKTALAAAPTQAAWLVEWQAHGHSPQWWGFRHEPGKRGQWCDDANKAIRFARKEDAERMRMHIIAVDGLTGNHAWEKSISATEHEWPDPAAPQPQAAPQAVAPAGYVNGASLEWLQSQDRGANARIEVGIFKTPGEACDTPIYAAAPTQAAPQPDWVTEFCAKWSGADKVEAGEVLDWLLPRVPAAPTQAAPAEAARVALPKEPPPGLLMSMAMRYDHGLGMPGYYDQFNAATTHRQRLESTLRTMRQLYEEVSGHGFYSPDKEAEYAAKAQECGIHAQEGAKQAQEDGR